MKHAFIIWRRQDGRNIGKRTANSVPFFVKEKQKQRKKKSNNVLQPLWHEIWLHLYGFVAHIFAAEENPSIKPEWMDDEERRKKTQAGIYNKNERKTM